MTNTHSAPSATLDSTTFSSLAVALRGSLIRPGDPEYDTARSLWNGMVDKRPGAIACCVGTADVVTAVRFAREHGIPVAVRGGGHNAAGNAMVDGGLTIDLSMMRGVWVDPARRIARVQGGATWADFDREAHLHGLATPGGAISMTGVAGLTLGGGLGWLMRKHGMTCDNLLSAEVVTADGNVVTASDDEHPDLLWGLKGGGGNFGIVTSFEFRMHPVDTVLSGMLVHPADRASEVLRFYRQFNASAPDELTTFAGLMISPEGDPIVALITCYAGDLERGAEVLRPLREYGPPLADTIAAVPYPQHQQMLDEGFPAGLQVYWRSHFLKTLNDEAIDSMVQHFGGITSPLSAIVIEQFGGAVGRVGAADTAFPHRSADYNVAIFSRWSDPTGADAHIAWNRQVHDALKPHANGVYVNYLGEEGADRVREAYGPELYERLAKLKRTWDPTNFFRLNQNIRPA
jgi:FAD/FMN-containing dehydrogenase